MHDESLALLDEPAVYEPDFPVTSDALGRPLKMVHHPWTDGAAAVKARPTTKCGSSLRSSQCSQSTFSSCSARMMLSQNE